MTQPLTHLRTTNSGALAEIDVALAWGFLSRDSVQAFRIRVGERRIPTRDEDVDPIRQLIVEPIPLDDGRWRHWRTEVDCSEVDCSAVTRLISARIRPIAISASVDRLTTTARFIA